MGERNSLALFIVLCDICEAHLTNPAIVKGENYEVLGHSR